MPPIEYLPADRAGGHEFSIVEGVKRGGPITATVRDEFTCSIVSNSISTIQYSSAFTVIISLVQSDTPVPPPLVDLISVLKLNYQI